MKALVINHTQELSKHIGRFEPLEILGRGAQGTQRTRKVVFRKLIVR